MLYKPDAPGDWGQMIESDTVKTATDLLNTPDGCTIFLRSWVTDSPDILLILHGLGAHSGWFIDMGNKKEAPGMTIYAMDHRGFGRFWRTLRAYRQLSYLRRRYQFNRYYNPQTAS